MSSHFPQRPVAIERADGQMTIGEGEYDARWLERVHDVASVERVQGVNVIGVLLL